MLCLWCYLIHQIMSTQLRIHFTLAFLLLIGGTVQAQSVDDVFSSGKILKQSQGLYINGMEAAQVDYARSVDPRPQDFERLPDSVLILAKGDKDQAAIYCQALNPLKYSYESDVVYYVDKIDEDADKALASIGDFITGYAIRETEIKRSNEKLLAAGVRSKEIIEVLSACSFESLRNTFSVVQTALEKNWKQQINDQFKLLAEIDFGGSAHPSVKVSEVNSRYEAIKVEIGEIETSINVFAKEVDNFKCDDPRFFIDRFTLNLMVEKLRHIKVQHDARLGNLKKALNAAEAVSKKVILSGSFYYMPTTFVDIKQGKIGAASITCYESGLMLNDAGEIVVREKKKVASRTILFRKFQRLVREVLAGVAYTGLKFPLYGTTTDSAGVTRVAEAGEEAIKRYAFNVMVNFNYYLSGSSLHPFWQIGIGTNLQNPVLLTGLGGRVRINNKLGFTISFGAAIAVIKDLQTLKPGDEVSGTADIEKDYKYDFDISRIKPYIGFQLAL